MPPIVFAAVILGAALHASWNAIVKRGRDTLLTTILVATVSGGVAILILPFVRQPAPESWPYIAVSAMVQVLYFVLVADVYRIADMSQAYPLMRGGAPVLVAVAGYLFLGEILDAGAWLGVALICAGVLAMGHGARRGPRRGVTLALGNACVIASYTLIDGAGARLSGAPVGYAMWLFALNALPLAGWALVTRRRAFIAYARTSFCTGFIGGIGNLGSYGLALWAMTQAPVAVVAALRETSILFAMAISALVLGERLTRGRLIAAGLIAGGAVCLRLT